MDWSPCAAVKSSGSCYAWGKVSGAIFFFFFFIIGILLFFCSFIVTFCLSLLSEARATFLDLTLPNLHFLCLNTCLIMQQDVPLLPSTSPLVLNCGPSRHLQQLSLPSRCCLQNCHPLFLLPLHCSLALPPPPPPHLP